MKKLRGIRELYQENPERADAIVFGRQTYPDRRGFLHGAGLATMGAMIGATIPFHRFMPGGLIPAAFAAEGEADLFAAKDGLTLLGDRPLNAETPAHLLDDDVTPNDRHFVRNNGLVPDSAMSGDASNWKLAIDGEVDETLNLSLDELKNRFEVVTYALQLECGGNGRAGFNPPASGNQWTVGAIGNARWTGVRLRDVLNAAGVKPDAVYTGHYGADPHLSGDPDKVPISRGLPLWKAMDPYTLIAFEMNGEPIPALHGFPARIVAPGWPGSCSQKWLTRVQLRNVVHDGPKMTGDSYRVPKYPVAPGEEVPESDMLIIQSMPVTSIITSPKSGTVLPVDNREVQVRGHAWAGDRAVSRVDVSHDFGETWTKTDLGAPPNPYSWQTFSAHLTFPTQGYYEIWARATDDEGVMQPFTVPGWNPKGYLNNSLHRVAVKVPT